MQPIISIIIPTYNRAHLISETLDSVLAQSYPHWECLVVDDGSSDQTAKIVGSYVAHDSRFQYYQRPDSHLRGGNGARNYGLTISRGTYINWLDSDDILFPNKLEIQVKQLESSNVNYCICQTEWLDRTTNTNLGLRAPSITSNNQMEDYICYKIFWSTAAPLWRKAFILNNNLWFDESLKQSQEYDFHIKALIIDQNYTITNQVMVYLIKHDSNLSNNWMQSSEKVYSNVLVKANVLRKYPDLLSDRCQFKLLEMVTIVYKKQLLQGNYQIAKSVRGVLLEMIKYMPVSQPIVTSFYIKSYLMYWSYCIFGKGYNILKPLNVDKDS